MADDILSLSADFPEGDEAQWRALVEKALKGGAPEKLNSRTYDGITVKALYRDSDAPAATDHSGVPGFAPFIRGASPAKDAYLPWDIRQIIAHPSPKQANADLIKDLECGVSSIELRIDAEAARGVCIRNVQDMKVVLEDVKLELAPVGLDTTGASAAEGLEAATLLAAYASESGEDAKALKLSFNLDPLGVLARTGALPLSVDDALTETAAFAKDAARTFPASTIIRADARPVHEAGGSEAQELAFLMASGASYMRALMQAGMSANEAARSILFAMSVGAEYVIEIAKLRAARRMWARVAEAFGATGQDAAMQLQAVSSRRMLTARDPWVNMLRNTAACFAGGVGGADIVTVRPFTDALGLPSRLARRIARNTQIIAQEESNLGKVIDPSGGAWSIAKLADDMALKAWSEFQAIEAQGGLAASLKSGAIQETVGKVRATRLRNIALRKEPVTGVSDFPLLDETKAETITADAASIASAAAKPTGAKPASRTFDALLAAARSGATLEDLSLDSDGAEADPLWPFRLAKPFERLRDHADAFEAKKGKRPQVFLAALGPLAEHTARTTFATNFFAAGGVEAIVAEGSPETLGEAFKSSGCLIACICGADTRYDKEAADAARALGAAGAGRLYVAGKGGDNEALWREAGVDEFIHVGVDVVASLELTHSELGLTL